MFEMLKDIAALSEKLDDSVSYAIEELTFLSAESAVDLVKVPENLEKCLTGSISIETVSAVYTMELLAERDFLGSIYTDIMVPGTDSEKKKDMDIDIVLELLNTITGNFMRKTEMLIGPFTIGIPKCEPGNLINANAFIIKKYLVDDKNLVIVAITKV